MKKFKEKLINTLNTLSSYNVQGIYNNKDIKHLKENEFVIDLIDGQSFKITVEEYK